MQGHFRSPTQETSTGTLQRTERVNSLFLIDTSPHPTAVSTNSIGNSTCNVVRRHLTGKTLQRKRVRVIKVDARVVGGTRGFLGGPVLFKTGAAQLKFLGRLCGFFVFARLYRLFQFGFKREREREREGETQTGARFKILSPF